MTQSTSKEYISLHHLQLDALVMVEDAISRDIVAWLNNDFYELEKLEAVNLYSASDKYT